MLKLPNDPNHNVAVFINDFDQEFADALEKLSARLGRKLRGVILIDSEVKRKNRNSPDEAQVFEQIVCDFYDDASLRQAIAPIENNLLLLTCSSDRNQPYLQQVLPHMPYILGPTESSLVWATHKAKMRELLGAYDPTLTPKVQPVTGPGEAEIQKVIDNLAFPIIVKPTGLAASVLVSKAKDEDELRKVLKASFSVIREIYQRDGGRGEPSMIAEEFIEGDMYSVDVYVGQDGTVWPLPLLRSTTGYAAGKEGFHIYQEDTLLELQVNDIAAGHDAAKRAVHALGLRSCVAHIELFKTDDGWRVIELGPRAGGQRQYIYEAAYNIDHAYNELLVKVGLEPEINNQLVSHVTIVRLYASQTGELTGITGLEEAKSIGSVYNLRQRAQVGDLVATSDNGGKALVDGVLSNTDLTKLYEDAARVRSIIKITTKRP
jgi:hypothetical protein